MLAGADVVVEVVDVENVVLELVVVVVVVVVVDPPEPGL